MLGYLLLIAGGGMMGSASLLRLEGLRKHGLPVWTHWQRRWKLSRTLVGQVSGGGIAALCMITAWSFPWSRSQHLLLLLGAGLSYVGLGVLVPRLPQKQVERRQKAIRMALSAAISEWTIALEAGDKLPALVRRYVARPRPQRRAIQQVMEAALSAVEQGAVRSIRDPITGIVRQERMLLADALVHTARDSGSQELLSVMTVLASAERNGGIRTAVPALRRAGQTLELVVQHEIDAMLTRRSLLLIAIAAPAVIGVVLLLLFVALAGQPGWL